MTIKQLAEKTQLTESFISQLERGLVGTSVASLKRVADALEISLIFSFGNKKHEGLLITKAERRKIIYPGLKTIDYLLTPIDSKQLQVVYTEAEPGGSSGDEPYTHDSDVECVTIISGELEIIVGGSVHILREGDSLTFSSRLPHKWTNKSKVTAKAIWAISPPSY